MKYLALKLAHWTKALVIAVLLMLPGTVTAQQGGTTQYTYDNNGRLSTVTLPSGAKVIYRYDPAGNITAIERSGTALTIISFNPVQGQGGDQVTIVGQGFDPISANNTVSFNGVQAQVVSATDTQMVVTVPQGATTGLISVSNTGGSVSSSTPFTIQFITLTPTNVNVLPDNLQQFNATVTPSTLGQQVSWAVNGIIGGNSSVGTISTTGLYLAPSSTLAQPVTVRATSTNNAASNLFAEATVHITNSVPMLRSQSISVQRGILPLLAKPFSPIVSVKKGLTGTNPPVIFSTLVSVTNGPLISALMPLMIVPGDSVTLTLNGSNFLGATSVKFINSTGLPTNSITATNINVSVDGQTLTATCSVAANTTLGSYTVIVVTANGQSVGLANSNNTLQVAP